MGEEAHLPGGGDTRRTGPRAARNTVSRAAGELVGKLATLVLIAALGRELGEAGVGTYFIALAFVLIATMPIEVGIDRYFLRRLARERHRSPELYDVLALKLVLAVPVISLSFLVVNLIGYNEMTRAAVYVLTPGLLLDSAARTVHHASYAFERASIAGLGLASRGILAAALGIAALLSGYGVVMVAAAYTTAAGVGFVIAFVLFARAAGLPSPRLTLTVWRGLVRNSLPFGVQDAFSVLLSRIDTIILSLLASATAVGRYGAAYRLLEATFVVSASINSAFAAMFTYLARDTEPSVATVYARAVKLALALLVPCAVVLAVLAEFFSRAIFGPELVTAAGPLRILSLAVPLYGVFYLSNSLIVSRLGATSMAVIAAGMVVINVVLNLLLVPEWGEHGTAAAMLATEVLAVPLVVFIAARAVGGIRLFRTLGGPLIAGASMAGAMLALGSPWPALAGGMFVYTTTLLAVERMLAPEDLRLVAAILRRTPATRRE